MFSSQPLVPPGERKSEKYFALFTDSAACGRVCQDWLLPRGRSCRPGRRSEFLITFNHGQHGSTRKESGFYGVRLKGCIGWSPGFSRSFPTRYGDLTHQSGVALLPPQRDRDRAAAVDPIEFDGNGGHEALSAFSFNLENLTGVSQKSLHVLRGQVVILAEDFLRRSASA